MAAKIADMKPYLEILPAVSIIHNIQNQHVLYMCDRGLSLLDTTLEKLQEMGADYHRLYFNAEDAKDYVPKLKGLLERNNNEEVVSFFQQVRHGENGDWHLWLSSIKLLMWDDNGIPLLTLTVTVPVDPDHNISSKVERILEENSFLRKNTSTYATLSKREREILALMALDKTSIEISERLFLSEDTVKTHRRNIKKKINAKNQYDVVRFAQAFEIV